jgi:hypothetical protein
MKKIIVICTEIKEYILGIAVSSKMFDEKYSQLLTNLIIVMSVRYHQIYHGQKQDCGMNDME